MYRRKDFVISAIIRSIRISASRRHFCFLPLSGICRNFCAIVGTTDEDAYIKVVLPIAIENVLECVPISEQHKNTLLLELWLFTPL